jgi:hypothetical protein
MTVLQVRPAFKPLNLVLYGISAALLVLGLWIASLPAPADRVQGYSALWMLPPETNAGRTVKIGIQSTELQTTSYELRVQFNDQIIQEWRDIILETGQGWSNSFQLPPTANASQVQAKLYRTDQPDTVYRIVHFQP